MADTVSFYFFSRGVKRSVHRPVKNREERITLENGLNEASRLRINPLMVSPSNHWNDLNGLGLYTSDVTRKKMAVSARHCILEWLFHAEKTRSKLPDRAIYTVFYRLINGLRRSDNHLAGSFERP